MRDREGERGDRERRDRNREEEKDREKERQRGREERKRKRRESRLSTDRDTQRDGGCDPHGTMWPCRHALMHIHERIVD